MRPGAFERITAGSNRVLGDISTYEKSRAGLLDCNVSQNRGVFPWG
jgi:hypothetical protein